MWLKAECTRLQGRRTDPPTTLEAALRSRRAHSGVSRKLGHSPASSPHSGEKAATGRRIGFGSGMPVFLHIRHASVSLNGNASTTK
ncbi:hypothetical protein [Thiothrix fructosivorans]|uniref:Uncharacterized protein n=1 Tax=Thiothrix fructosivorans TaxID=111770 RepID=A0ABS3IS91_9GAMM|nr:hypothetical protein [Thiothrix fructosivorans]MBO0615421.1 hypothetical protein [Thiothrix fructosivorans]